MAVATLVHRMEEKQIEAQRLIRKCGLFKRDEELFGFPYAIKATVALEVFHDFVSELEGNRVKVTNENFPGLSLLCEEFRYKHLEKRLSKFQVSLKDDEVRLGPTTPEQRYEDNQQRTVEMMECKLTRFIKAHGRIIERVNAIESECSKLCDELSRLCPETVSVIPQPSQSITEEPKLAAKLRSELSLLKDKIFLRLN
jgi:hypothetical protein